MLIASMVVVVLILASGSAIFFLNSKGSKKPSAEDQKASEYSQRLIYLLKIVVDHSSGDKRDQSSKEVMRVGEEVNAEGGFRLMVKIQQAVQNASNEKIAARLSQLWKGVGEWR